jgi:hypothetical protein
MSGNDVMLSVNNSPSRMMLAGLALTPMWRQYVWGLSFPFRIATLDLRAAVLPPACWRSTVPVMTHARVVELNGVTTGLTHHQRERPQAKTALR